MGNLCFDKKSSGGADDKSAVKRLVWSQFASLRSLTVHENQQKNSSFKDNILGDYLADMQLISKYDKGFRFSLCVIDIFSKYEWVVPLK